MLKSVVTKYCLFQNTDEELRHQGHDFIGGNAAQATLGGCHRP